MGNSTLFAARGREVIRTRTRPAIEFVSGEQGLRPKSYFFVFSSIVKYAYMHLLKYLMALAPLLEQRECGGAVLSKHSSSRELCVVCLPIRAAAFAAGAPRVQLRASYADWAGYGVACLHPRWLDFLASDYEEPTEECRVRAWW